MLLPNYTRFEEVSRRLVDSLIRYKGDPVYVSDISYQPLTPTPQSQRFTPGIIYRGWLCMPTDLDTREDLIGWLSQSEEWYGWFSRNYGDPAELAHPLDYYHEVLDYFDRRTSNPTPSRLNMADIVAASFKIDTREQVNFRLNDLGVNLVPVQLGYVNYPSNCCYVSRTPDRRCYKQGLSSQALRTDNGFITLSDDKFLADTIRGTFPTLRECLSELAGRDDLNRRAFHRHLAIELDRDVGVGYLEYKRKRIGHSPDCVKWHLSPKYHFMRDTLIDHGMELVA